MSGPFANKTPIAVLTALVCACWALPAAPAAASTNGASASDTGASGGSGGTTAGTPTKHAPKEQIATWFGPGLYGRQTACGQTLTPVIVGVANRTLPCGTLVLIGYKGHSLTVPVIDRGPYGHNGASWDLTRGAANALEIEETVRIQTKVVGKTTNSPLLGVPAEVTPTPEEQASGGTASPTSAPPA